MTQPSIAALMDAVGISKTYASDILGNRQPPSRALAVHIFRKTGWKAPVIADLSEPQIDVLEQALGPWQPPKSAAQEAA